MTFECKDLERALAVPELLPEAREHARTCDACRRDLWLWSEMSKVAPRLRQEWESPELWPRIHQALAAQQKAAQPRRAHWRMWAGLAFAAALAMAVLLLAPSRPAPQSTPASDLLTEQALREVEQTEAAYRASIDKLSGLAEPKLNTSTSELAVATREKLLVLDSEISEVRSTMQNNRFNARLQTELASLYRQKQDTLKEILQRGQSN